jgi:hypothetical protein
MLDPSFESGPVDASFLFIYGTFSLNYLSQDSYDYRIDFFSFSQSGP